MPFALLPLTYGLAAVAFLRMPRSHTVRTIWRWPMVIMVLTTAASIPGTWAITSSAAGEWCESPPGGRGFNGESDPSQISLPGR